MGTLTLHRWLNLSGFDMFCNYLTRNDIAGLHSCQLYIFSHIQNMKLFPQSIFDNK